ncbi:beta-ketoacyl-ACP synthase [Aerolutibacter daejeonensis]|uniref:beta-ketoacyl-ACP synthase n=1 Tax=Aerolutibacter daejeonensis TaxID=346181 RepID=UPI0009FE903F|nr:beta-ketoacyl-ACP synthase [Lysobacter daejeonensis]
MSTPVYLNQLGIVCALGQGADAVANALFGVDAPVGVATSDAFTPGRALAVGQVPGPLPALGDVPMALRTRNNALLRAAYAQLRPAVDAAIARHGAHRVAVIVGTSTSGIGEAEQSLPRYQRDGRWPAEFHYAQQEIGAPSRFLAHESGARGPAWTLSTACSSSAKALASAARLLRAGIVDAVIAGGADSLCGFTIAGFSALEAVSGQRCNPFSAHRNGINIGEAAALFLMTREPGPVTLAGWGESSDAHHMSAPEPSGAGAIAAIEQALARAGIAADAVDYVNLHGTATPQNDAMESRAAAATFGARVPVSSTKPLTGHTLGAAGALEAGLCWLAMARNPQHRLPPHWWDGTPDPELPALAFVAPGQRAARPLRHVLSHSFAFGGSNAVLLFGRGDRPAGAGHAPAPAAAMPDIEQVIPHRGTMLLVDRLVHWDDETVAVELAVPADSPFHVDGGVPAYVGVEYMAQAVACWAGCHARARGAPPPIGFLLGTRRYECAVPLFSSGLQLRVEARREILGENGLGVFACRILAADRELATANVSVFEPPDAMAYLENET